MVKSRTRKYVYRENNSGGSFETEWPHEIIVYASRDKEADKLAEEAGAYFDGVEKGIDCGCCGDRWHRTSGPEE